MDAYILERLMAKHSTLDKDKLDLFNRIRSDDKNFVSSIQSIEYIKEVIEDRPNTINNPLNKSFKELPILAINIIDEAICSLAKEIFKMRSINDFDNISYIRKNVEDLCSYIRNKNDDLGNFECYRYEKIFLECIGNTLQSISTFAFPAEEFEEDMIIYAFSKNYYTLMFNMYGMLMDTRDEYIIKMNNFYLDKIKIYYSHG